MRKLKTFYLEFSGILLCIFLVLFYLFEYNFEVTSIVTSIIILILFFIINAVFLFGIYKSEFESLNIISLFILPILFIPMILTPICLIPLGVVVFLFFKSKRYRAAFIVAVVLYTIIYSGATLINLFFNGMSDIFVTPEITDIKKVNSPDNKHVLILQQSDQGALGGNVIVIVENKITPITFLGITERSSNIPINEKTLYWGDYMTRPKISWIDNETVLIKNKKFNINHFTKWDDSH